MNYIHVGNKTFISIKLYHQGNPEHVLVSGNYWVLIVIKADPLTILVWKLLWR